MARHRTWARMCGVAAILGFTAGIVLLVSGAAPWIGSIGIAAGLLTGGLAMGLLRRSGAPGVEVVASGWTARSRNALDPSSGRTMTVLELVAPSWFEEVVEGGRHPAAHVSIRRLSDGHVYGPVLARYQTGPEGGRFLAWCPLSFVDMAHWPPQPGVYRAQWSVRGERVIHDFRMDGDGKLIE